MPVSKKRKKKGKKVGNGQARLLKQTNQRIERFGDRESSITLQDLINVVAYQEHNGLVGSGTVLADDVEIHIPEEVPVTVGEGDDKREVGTATRIPGDEDAVSINITDPEVLSQLSDARDNYSIDTEENN